MMWEDGWIHVDAPFDVAGWNCVWWKHKVEGRLGVVATSQRQHEGRPYGIRQQFTAEFIADPIAPKALREIWDKEMDHATEDA